MKFKNAVFNERGQVRVEIDGNHSVVPIGSSAHDEMVEAGIEVAEYVEPIPTYDELRRKEYGFWGDQLDMQYHDSVDGTTTWLDHVARVKAAHPKS